MANKSFYGNVINPPKYLSEIDANSGAFTVQNLGDKLTLLGDNIYTNTSINSEGNLIISHINNNKNPLDPFSHAHDTENIQENVTYGSIVSLPVLTSVNVDALGHVVSAAMRNYNLSLIGKRYKDENGELQGEIFNDYTNNKALSSFSHAEGHNTQANDLMGSQPTYGAHAEGDQTKALGKSSHAEGIYTETLNLYAHAEGQQTYASGVAAHSEGALTKALGMYTHAEGAHGISIGDYSHVEGSNTPGVTTKITEGIIENYDAYNDSNIVITQIADIESLKINEYYLISFSYTSYLIKVTSINIEEKTINAILPGGIKIKNNLSARLVEIHFTGYVSGMAGHGEGKSTIVTGNYGHAEGELSVSQGRGAHAEGELTVSQGRGAHAEGKQTTAKGEYSHSEGVGSCSEVPASHTEGRNTWTIGYYAHAEGKSNYNKSHWIEAGLPQPQYDSNGNITNLNDIILNWNNNINKYTIAAGIGSHAEGFNTLAAGLASHSEGEGAQAIGAWSHVGGKLSKAQANQTFVHGEGLVADSEYQTVFGKYNYIPSGNDKKRIFQIGWGDNDSNRRDLLYLTREGDLFAKDFKISNDYSLQTVNTDLQNSKEALRFGYVYDPSRQKLAFFQGTQQIGEEINIPINAVVNNAQVEEGSSILILTVNIEDENGKITQKELEIDLGAVAIDQALLGDTNTITMYQSEEDKLHKIKADINSYSIKGGKGTSTDIRHLSITEGERITADNLENQAVTNEKLSSINPKTGLGASVNTNNLFNNSVTTEKLFNNSVTTDKLSSIKDAEAVTTETIRDNAITNSKIDSVSFEKVYGSIPTDRLEGTITNEQLEGEITSDKLASNFYTDYIDTKLDKNNSVGNGSISYNRKKDTDIGKNSCTFGLNNIASMDRAFAEGYATQAINYNAHAEGNQTIASGAHSHAEGEQTVASGARAHAEGYLTIASGDRAHAEGTNTEANGSFSHAEGTRSQAIGTQSHAQNYETIARGSHSHAEGQNTIVNGIAAHVQGRFNLPDTFNAQDYSEYAHIVGNGKSDTQRSNAHTLDWDGNAWYAGSIETNDKIILRSSSIKEDGTRSNKKFALTINDEGVLSIEEV